MSIAYFEIIHILSLKVYITQYHNNKVCCTCLKCIRCFFTKTVIIIVVCRIIFNITSKTIISTTTTTTTLNYLLLLRCFKIVPILGLVVYTIALLVPSMVQPFNIRGVQEAATSLKANEAPGYASSGSDAAVKNAVVHIGPHKTYWFGNGRSLESYFDLLKPYLFDFVLLATRTPTEQRIVVQFTNYHAKRLFAFHLQRQ